MTIVLVAIRQPEWTLADGRFQSCPPESFDRPRASSPFQPPIPTHWHGALALPGADQGYSFGWAFSTAEISFDGGSSKARAKRKTV